MMRRGGDEGGINAPHHRRRRRRHFPVPVPPRERRRRYSRGLQCVGRLAAATPNGARGTTAGSSTAGA